MADRGNRIGASEGHHSCFCKKYKNRKCRSVAFQNAGKLRWSKHHNVSAWDTQSKINQRHYER